MPKRQTLFLALLLCSLLCVACDSSNDADSNGADSGDTEESDHNTDASTDDVDSGDTDTPNDTSNVPGSDDDSTQSDYPVSFEPAEACDIANLSANHSSGDLCDDGALYCNGGCLLNHGDTADKCEAVAIGIPQGEGLTIDGEYMYFSAADSVYRIALTTGNTECVLGGLSDPEGMLVDGDVLYVGQLDDYGVSGVVRVGTDGGNPMLMAEHQYGGTNFQILGDRLLFTGQSIFTDDLFTMPRSGGTISDFMPHVMGIQSYAIVGDDFYYINNELERAPLNNLTESEYMGGGAFAHEIFESGGTVYIWGDINSDNMSEFFRLNAETGEPLQLAETTHGVKYLTHNRTHVFFTYYDTEEGTKNVYAIPLSGGEPTNVASFEHGTHVETAAVTEDGLYLYVDSEVNGIVKVALD